MLFRSWIAAPHTLEQSVNEFWLRQQDRYRVGGDHQYRRNQEQQEVNDKLTSSKLRRDRPAEVLEELAERLMFKDEKQRAADTSRDIYDDEYRYRGKANGKASPHSVFGVIHEFFSFLGRQPGLGPLGSQMTTS